MSSTSSIQDGDAYFRFASCDQNANTISFVSGYSPNPLAGASLSHDVKLTTATAVVPIQTYSQTCTIHCYTDPFYGQFCFGGDPCSDPIKGSSGTMTIQWATNSNTPPSSSHCSSKTYQFGSHYFSTEGSFNSNRDFAGNETTVTVNVGGQTLTTPPLDPALDYYSHAGLAQGKDMTITHN